MTSTKQRGPFSPDTAQTSNRFEAPKMYRIEYDNGIEWWQILLAFGAGWLVGAVLAVVVTW